MLRKDYNMSLTIGETIKKLRKERNLTQDDLAEQLNVTFQAVSKWENGTGLLDISQVVPLASVFGVSTDLLFGRTATSDNDEVLKIITKINKSSGEITKYKWDELQEGLRQYPSNLWLLMASLEYGIALAYPENACYDEVHGVEIHRECIRQAYIITSYSQNPNDILRANMIMVILQSAYGNIERAREHANKFPLRSDMTYHLMSAYIAHHEKNFADEADHSRKKQIITLNHLRMR